MEYKNLISKLEDIGKFVKDTYKDKLKSGGHIATGKLYNSIDYKVEFTESSILVKFLAEDYYINIEEGRKPNGKFPPLDVIRKWIIAKGLPNKPGLDYLISRKIALEGIKPKPYLRETIEMLPNITNDLEVALKRDVELLIKEKLNNGNSNKII